jgi:hypothetical protein
MEAGFGLLSQLAHQECVNNIYYENATANRPFVLPVNMKRQREDREGPRPSGSDRK